MDATAYHNLTSYSRGHMTPHYLDWDHVPLLQKAYPTLPSQRLMPPAALPDRPLAEVLSGCAADASRQPRLGFQELSNMLMLANGITAKRRYGSQTQFFRSAPSAGALYPNEIYLAAERVTGLDPGLYNYQVMDGLLVELRRGATGLNVQNALIRKSNGLPAATLLVTGVFFRSAWKYRDRAFRYVLLDAGHLIENLVLAAGALGYVPAVHYDFDDLALERLLGIDPGREACLAVVTLFAEKGADRRKQTEPQPDPPLLPRELIGASQTSPAEIRYGKIQAVCAAGSIVKAAETDRRPDFAVTANSPEKWLPIRSEAVPKGEQSFAASALGRRSRRNFVPVPLSADRAGRLMQCLCGDLCYAADEGLVYRGCMTTGMATVNVKSCEPGVYLLNTRDKAFGLVSAGISGRQIARTCLDQEWLQNGQAHFLFMANLSLIDRYMGARGYRYAMMNAGRAGQRVYLAATALGLGACGIGALYDDEARRLLELNSESALLYLLAVGATKSKW